MGLFKPGYVSRNQEKAKKALDRITDERQLSEVVRNREALNAIREEALDRINDDIILAETITSENSFGDVKKAVAKISSPRAREIIRENIKKKNSLSFDWYHYKENMAFLRSLDDTDILRLVFICETNKSCVHESDFLYSISFRKQVFEDALKLKEAGTDPQELADRIRKVFPAEAGAEAAELLLKDVLTPEILRRHMDDLHWILSVRGFVPVEMFREAFPPDDPAYQRMLQSYQIVDGTVFTSKCQFGEHDWVEDSSEKEDFDDPYHPHTYTYYHCSACGKKKWTVRDGYGRIDTYYKD